MLKKLEFNGNPFLGVFCKANDATAFIQQSLPKKTQRLVEETLNVKTIEISISGGTIIGSLMAMNSHGAIITNYTEKEERKIYKKS